MDQRLSWQLLVVIAAAALGGASPRATGPVMAPQTGAEVRRVEIAIADGAMLKATYYSPGRPGPGVVLFHQCDMDGRSWETLAAALAARGIHVLTFDYPGRGDNRALSTEYAKYPAAFDAVLEWLAASPGVDGGRVAAGGASCGVDHAVQLARRHARIKALLLLSGPTSAEGLAHIQRSNLPVFLAFSADEGGPLPAMKAGVGASTHQATTIRELNRAGHGVPMFTAVPSLLPEIAQWIAAVLSPATTQAERGPRDSTHLIYDSGRQQLLLLVSSRESGQQEMWRRDASRWTRVPGSHPPARELGGAAYDTRRRRLVIQGGIGPSPSGDRKGDTWEWDGTGWHSIAATTIGARDHHAMAYDEARGRIVLFGGAGASNRDLASDTWEYDGSTWTRVATDGPPGRAHFGMVYDAQRRHVVIFGGLAKGTPASSTSYGAARDTWAWDGKSWQKLSDVGPSPRTHFRMAFDRRTNKIVVFGGKANGSLTTSLADTWTWDGQRWTEVTTAGPSARGWHLMAFDEMHGRTILYGGSVFDGKVSTYFQDTWAWDGENWSPY